MGALTHPHSQAAIVAAVVIPSLDGFQRRAPIMMAKSAAKKRRIPEKSQGRVKLTGPVGRSNKCILNFGATVV